MSWTDPASHSYAPAEILTAATLNTYVRQNLSYLGNAPNVSVSHSLAQTTTTGALFTLAWNEEVFKNVVGMHSTTVNNSRLIAPVTAKYLVTINFEFPANATGVRSLGVNVNAGLQILAASSATVGGANPTQLTCSRVVALVANDYLTAFAFQTSGGNLNVNTNGAYSPSFTMTWISF
jgi:hypothetical protein